MARPSDYTPEIGIAICVELADGKSLRTVCRMEGMPCTKTIFNWFRAHPEFLAMYTRAKEESADADAEDIKDIADDGRNDWMACNDPDNPGYKLNGEHVQRSRLRVDTRKWLASKLKPKKFGDKLELGGPDGGPLQVQIIDPTRRADSSAS
jgi:hypothetical protein